MKQIQMNISTNGKYGWLERGTILVVGKDVQEQDAERWLTSNLASEVRLKKTRIEIEKTETAPLKNQNGENVSPSEEVPNAKPEQLPSDFPLRSTFIDLGFSNVEDIQAMDDELLLNIHGLGQKTLEDIRSYEG